MLAFIHDENVVAKLFGFVQDLRSEDDGAAALGFLAEQIHDRAFEDGIHAGGKFVEKDDRRFDHEGFGNLHTAAVATAQVHDFLGGFALQME